MSDLNERLAMRADELAITLDENAKLEGDVYVLTDGAQIFTKGTRFRIILTNAVKYVTNVESYDRRIQSAINIQGRKMQRRAEFLLTRALRKAGWK